MCLHGRMKEGVDSVLQCVAVCQSADSVLQSVATCYRVLQSVAECCRVSKKYTYISSLNSHSFPCVCAYIHINTCCCVSIPKSSSLYILANAYSCMCVCVFECVPQQSAKEPYEETQDRTLLRCSTCEGFMSHV